MSLTYIVWRNWMQFQFYFWLGLIKMSANWNTFKNTLHSIFFEFQNNINFNQTWWSPMSSRSVPVTAPFSPNQNPQTFEKFLSWTRIETMTFHQHAIKLNHKHMKTEVNYVQIQTFSMTFNSKIVWMTLFFQLVQSDQFKYVFVFNQLRCLWSKWKTKINNK